MPFGKYQDKELTDLPEAYLRWLRSQPWVGRWLLEGLDEVLGEKAEWVKESAEVAAFSVHNCAGEGPAIVNCDGEIIAWTTDALIAQIVCKLLNENSDLFHKQEGELK